LSKRQQDRINAIAIKREDIRFQLLKRQKALVRNGIPVQPAPRQIAAMISEAEGRRGSGFIR
jgi:hypothetical protein